MKKVIILIFISLILFVSACGTSDETNATTNETNSTSGQAAEEEVIELTPVEKAEEALATYLDGEEFSYEVLTTEVLEESEDTIILQVEQSVVENDSEEAYTQLVDYSVEFADEEWAVADTKTWMTSYLGGDISENVKEAITIVTLNAMYAEQEKLDEYMATMHLEGEGSIEATKEAALQTFENWDLEYELTIQELNEENEDTIYLTVDQKNVEKNSAPNYNNNIATVKHGFMKVDGDWKLFTSEMINSVPLY